MPLQLVILVLIVYPFVGGELFRTNCFFKYRARTIIGSCWNKMITSTWKSYTGGSLTGVLPSRLESGWSVRKTSVPCTAKFGRVESYGCNVEGQQATTVWHRRISHWGPWQNILLRVCKIDLIVRKDNKPKHEGERKHFFFFFFFKSSGGWVKIKLKLPHFHVWDACVSI